MNYDYETYWEERVRRTITKDDFKLGVVCYFMPKWYDALFDYFQKKAFSDTSKNCWESRKKEMFRDRLRNGTVL